MIRQLKIEKLKELYSDQCGPCVSCPENCKGNADKAKVWKCKEFTNGLTIVTY